MSLSNATSIPSGSYTHPVESDAVTTFAPGVGAFLVPASIVKLSMTFGSKGINLYCKKHPDGKFTKFVDKQKAKDHARVEKFEETNIGKKVKVVKNFLNKKEVKWALNGFAMGYLGYNVFHVIHGFTTTTRIGTMNPENSYDPTIRGRVHPTINSSPADVSNTVAETVNNTVTETAETVANTTSSVEQAIEAGQVVDVSSISKGFVSSTAPEPVQLLQSAGKHVVLDQQVVLENGQEMWHMMQTDANGVSIGKGLGWFTKEDVINAAQNLTQSGMSR